MPVSEGATGYIDGADCDEQACAAGGAWIRGGGPGESGADGEEAGGDGESTGYVGR